MWIEPNADEETIANATYNLDGEWNTVEFDGDGDVVNTAVTISAEELRSRSDKYNKGFSGRIYVRITDNAGNSVVALSGEDGSFVVLDDEKRQHNQYCMTEV